MQTVIVKAINYLQIFISILLMLKACEHKNRYVFDCGIQKPFRKISSLTT